MLLSICSAAFGLFIIEVGLRTLTPYPNHLPRSNQVPDKLLGYRMRPYSFGTNSEGFRSPEASKPIHFIAIGDSHTFGINASELGAWPALTASRNNWTFYNLGTPGYNIGQYYHLFQIALRLKPKIIILAIYPYNDFEEFCATPELRAENVVLRASESPTSEEARCDGLVGDGPSETAAASTLSKTAIASVLRDFFRIAGTRSPKVPFLGRDDVFRIIERQVNVSFALPERTAYLNRVRMDQVSSTRARQALSSLFKMIGDASDHSENGSQSLKTMVVIVPSKDRVFQSTKRWIFPSEVIELQSYERALTSLVITTARKFNLATCDLNHDLVRALASGGSMYPTHDNSHPQPEGYAVYSDGIQACLRRFEMLDEAP